MPGLVHRYSPADEHAALLSTSPRTPQRASRAAFARAQAASWYNAAVPPLSDVQAALHRAQRDPALSQTRTFRFLAPLVVFAVLFAAAALAFDPRSGVHRVLAHWHGQTHAVVAVLCLGTVLGGVSVALIVLRMIIWGFAEIAGMVTAGEQRVGRRGNTVELPSSNVLLGSMFTNSN